MRKIILTGGGTAGHVTPNLALIPYLQKKGYEIHYIGSEGGMEESLVKAYNIPYYGISSGKLRRYLDKENISDIFRVIKGIAQARRLINKIKPDIIFSKGGFVAVPVVIGAAINKVPVIAHESDITPGLANKIANPFAKAVCTTFPEAVKHIKGNKGIYTGTPIRETLFTGSKLRGLEYCSFKRDKPILLVMGGSQGSVMVNNKIRESLPKLLEKFNVIHLCGKGNISYEFNNLNGYKQFEYVSNELSDILACSDIVVSRAGSNAICELLALNKPMLLIPLGKGASRGDQILNANSFEKQGFAKVCFEDDITEDCYIYDEIINLYENKENYINKMKLAQAANGINEVLDVITAVAN